MSKSQLKYLGHVLGKHVIHPAEDKVRLIQKAVAATNVKKFQAFFLGGGLIIMEDLFTQTKQTKHSVGTTVQTA